MKNLVFVICFAVFSNSIALAQSDPAQPLYERFPTPPPVKLLLIDSVTIFTDKDLKKNIPVFFMIFSPDCDHCQKHAEEMIKQKDRFKNIQVVMASMQPLYKVKEFYENYQLSQMPRLVIGQDREFIVSTFFKMKSLPFLAFYDKKLKLISVFEGALPIEKILENFD